MAQLLMLKQGLNESDERREKHQVPVTIQFDDDLPNGNYCEEMTVYCSPNATMGDVKEALDKSFAKQLDDEMERTGMHNTMKDMEKRKFPSAYAS